MQPKAVEAAIKEVLSPTLGVTEQILSIHKLVMQNTLPVIARVQDKSDGAYHIYFAVESEPYYFVVVVSFPIFVCSRSDSLTTRQKNMEPQFENINNYEKHLTNKGTINNS